MSEQRPLFELHLTGPALKAFDLVAKTWNTSAEEREALLGPASRTGSLNLDQVERISLVLSIFRMLQTLTIQDHRSWLDTPRTEAIYAGRTPMAVMCLNDLRGLRQVVKHLNDLAGVNDNDHVIS